MSVLHHGVALQHGRPGRRPASGNAGTVYHAHAIRGQQPPRRLLGEPTASSGHAAGSRSGLVLSHRSACQSIGGYLEPRMRSLVRRPARLFSSLFEPGSNSPASASKFGRRPPDAFQRQCHGRGYSRPTAQQARQGPALATQTSSRVGDVPSRLVHALPDQFAQMRRVSMGPTRSLLPSLMCAPPGRSVIVHGGPTGMGTSGGWMMTLISPASLIDAGYGK